MMAMSDAERLDLLVRMLEDMTILCRDLVGEVTQHREITSREEDLLSQAGEVLGKEL